MSWFALIGDDLPLDPKPPLPQISAGSSEWPEERVEKLRELYKLGLSATEIAKELCLETRNQVIGKVRHLGLTREKHNHRRNAVELAARPGCIPKPHPKRLKPEVKPAAPKLPPPPPEPVVMLDLDPATNVTIHDLTEHTCKWPVSDDPRVPVEEFFYCGALTDIGDSYCPFHLQLSYNRVPPRKDVYARPRA